MGYVRTDPFPDIPFSTSYAGCPHPRKDGKGVQHTVDSCPDPLVSITLKLGYSPVAAMERLRKASICGLVVSRDQHGWHLCQKKTGHEGHCGNR